MILMYKIIHRDFHPFLSCFISYRRKKQLDQQTIKAKIKCLIIKKVSTTSWYIFTWNNIFCIIFFLVKISYLFQSFQFPNIFLYPVSWVIRNVEVYNIVAINFCWIKKIVTKWKVFNEDFIENFKPIANVGHWVPN
jgi:hypothetical protein